jgi:hypothetical protein
MVTVLFTSISMVPGRMLSIKKIMDNRWMDEWMDGWANGWTEGR